MNLHPPTDAIVGDFTERELFSIYARYPDLDFDPEAVELIPEADNIQSPTTDTGDYDVEEEFTHLSGSTTYTTPIRFPIDTAFASRLTAYSRFIRRIEVANLPTDTCRYFRDVGYQILQIGKEFALLGRDQMLEPKHDAFHEQTTHMLEQCLASAERCRQQVGALQYVKSLTAFNVLPMNKDLLSNYRQRASLIVRYCAVPCLNERKLIDSLTQLFDANIYQPFLLLGRTEQIDKDVKIINALYDAIMSWQEVYQHWWREADDLRGKYMTPIMNRIQESAEIMQEAAKLEQNIHTAKAVLAMKPLLASKEAILVLLSSEKSKTGVPSKTKTRYRREWTI